MTSSDNTAPRSKAQEVMARMFRRGMPVHLEADEGAPEPSQKDDKPQASSEETLQQASRSKAEDETR